MTNKNNKKNIGIILGSSAAVAVLTAGLIFGTAGCSTKQAQTGFKTTTVTVDKNSTNTTAKKTSKSSTDAAKKAAEAKKAADAKKAAEAKKAEEARKAAEAKKAEEARKAEAAKKAAQQVAPQETAPAVPEVDQEEMSALNKARAQAMLHTGAPEAESNDEQSVKGTVKSVDGKKVTITIGEKTYTFENNKEDLKLQKGDKVSVVLVKDT